MSQTGIPRRRAVRFVLRQLIHAAFGLFARVRVIGQENLPPGGPLVVVANHFNFADPVALIHVLPWEINFVAAAVPGFAPRWATVFPRMWGAFWVYRGTGSRDALKLAERWLKQKGVLCIFPEGGAWAQVLRPPRPGTAYLATRGEAPILPVAIYGLEKIFPLRLVNRPEVIVRIGEQFGPFRVQGRGRERRRQIDRIGHIIMEHIAALLPEEMRGRYSSDPAIREAARPFEAYPWENAVEGEIVG